MNKQKHCTKCGKELLPKNKFCVSCGAEIQFSERNFNTKNKTSNAGKGYEKNLIIAITLMAVSFIFIAVLLPSDDSRDYSNQSSNLKNNSVTPSSYFPSDNSKEESKTPEKINQCPNTTINDLSVMNEYSYYRLYDLSNNDPDIKIGSNEMKVSGIIKNSSKKCYATDIKMKFFLIRDDGEIIQEEKFVLKETISNIDNLQINPNSKGEFSEVFKAYDSLIIGRYHKQLKPNIEIKYMIISAKWNLWVY